jgi:hypothetical protein
LPTSTISSSPLLIFASAGSDKTQILALDGDSNDVVTLPSSGMPMQGYGNKFNKAMLDGAFEGTNPFTIDNLPNI